MTATVVPLDGAPHESSGAGGSTPATPAPALPGRGRTSLAAMLLAAEARYSRVDELFATFLDQTMTGSSGRFDLDLPRDEQSLEAAQVRKVDGLLDGLEVGYGTRLLELGTDWGHLATRAALRGAHVVTVTSSVAQAAFARERVLGAGVAGAVDVRVGDWREVTGAFDAVVSVDVVESLSGAEQGDLARALDAHLSPGGRAAVQTTLSVPALRRFNRELRRTTVRTGRVELFGPDHAETLRRWRGAFAARADDVAALGYDEVFRRRWDSWLAAREVDLAGGVVEAACLWLERCAAASSGPAAA